MNEGFTIERVGFIGSGSVARALGRLAGRRGFNLGFYDINPARASDLASELNGVMFADMEELISWSDLVVVSVPGPIVPRVLGRTLDLIRSSGGVKAVTDVSTFKRDVIEVYDKTPSNAIAASSHPLFGRRVKKPESHRAVIIPIPGRDGDAAYIEGFYKKLGVTTSIVDWRTHDIMVARTIGASYLVGLAVRLLHRDTGDDMLESFMSTTFSLLWTLAEAVSSDSQDLIKEIIMNDETVKVAKELARLMNSIPERDIRVEGGRSEAYDYIYRFVEDVRKPRACSRPNNDP